MKALGARSGTEVIRTDCRFLVEDLRGRGDVIAKILFRYNSVFLISGSGRAHEREDRL
jgi:hypothetical protein